MKRITALVLAFILILPTFFVGYAENTDWGADKIYSGGSGRYMPFSPGDKLMSKQNPPSFTWPYVYKAVSYDLVISTDPDFSDTSKIRFKKEGLKTNYYNFDCTFSTGVNYYWGVRYHTASAVSAWSDARRFKIDPDASVFKVADIDTLMSRLPSTHPRIWTTKDNLAEFLSYADTNKKAKEIRDNAVKNAQTYVDSGEIPPEPTEFGSAALSGTYKMTSKILTSAFAYLMTNDKAIGEFAVKLMSSVSEWDWDDTTGPTSYIGHDQAHRDIALKTAMAYDWVYDLLNDGKHEREKSKIVNMISARTTRMAGLTTSLQKSPYDSHGWTALGFIGIIAVAMHGDIPEADAWLRDVVPLYTAVIPPWSGQEGGWSQGTDYWRYSTNQGGEFIDVLALCGMLNLYDCAWLQNQYLWALYAYPEGSYGSFGDQSNITKSENSGDTAQSMGRVSAFTDDPVTKWISERTGGLNNNLLNYYVSQNEKTKSHTPIEYPLSHVFKDIGWAVMTDSLTNPDRVQLTFKSSPYGSYNHSMADQNGFIIQAFGEKLAIKSGFYDSYHSVHDNNITRKSFSLNTITTDDYDGQGYYGTKKTDAQGRLDYGVNDDFNSKGHLLQFVNQMRFDSVMGDATEAYKDSPAGNTKRIGKYVRNIIYVRPDVFVVVDDLAAKGNEESRFKWWLNSEKQMEYGDNYAVISQGEARMRTDVLYPSDIISEYYKGFVDIRGAHWPAIAGAGSYINTPEHDRISFATSKTNSTKMVTAMSVYKSDGEAKRPRISYSDDNKCMCLEFDGGTTVLVNLTDDIVSYGGITFRGAAVACDEGSIMLTNGTLLKEDGAELVSSTQPSTVAFGCGQICISSDYDAEICVNRSNKYISVPNKETVTDVKGRVLKSAIGVWTSIYGSSIKFNAQKGDYTFLINSENPVSDEDMIPRDVALRKENGKLYAEWTNRGGCAYDISVNGAVTENVTSPYEITGGDLDETISISLRGKIGNIMSEWCQNAFYNPKQPIGMSKIEYTKNDEKTVLTAKMSVDGVPDGLKMITGMYNRVERLIGFKEVDVKSGVNEIVLTDDDIKNADKIKTFVLDGSLKPLKSASYYKSDSTDLIGIYIDGVLIEDFSNDKDEYNIIMPDSSSKLYPNVTAASKDGACKVSVADNPDETQTIISLTAPGGSTRTVKVNFEIERGNKHRVVRAESDSKFVNDKLASGGKVADGVGIFEYKLNGAAKTERLSLRSETKSNRGGSNFGSLVCSDRSNNSGNLMEVAALRDNLQGWDYFVLSQDNYYYNQEKCSDEKLTFTLAESAEVTVIGIDSIDSILNDGFYGTTGEFGKARYINPVGAEDVYYNVNFNGRSESDLTSGHRIKNYDIRDKWIDVNPLYKTDENGQSVAYTKEDYEAEKPSADKFVPTGNSEPWTQNYKFTYKYSKSYDTAKDGNRVTLDLSGMKSNKTLIIIKNSDFILPISNVKYLGPTKFDDLDESLRAGCTDDYKTKNAISYSSTGIMQNNFGNGAKAYSSVGEIYSLCDYPDLEGAYYFPVFSNAVQNWQATRWQMAYYCGLGELSGTKYPGFEGKTHDWYSFSLNQSADLYMVCMGEPPRFIDSTWEKLNTDGAVFSTTGIPKTYNGIYKKYIHVNDGQPEEMVFKTPGNVSGTYYLVVKPIK